MNTYKNLLVNPGPKSLVGWGALDHLIPTILERKALRVLAIIDPVIVQLPLLQSLFSEMKQQGINYELYTKITPEPSLEIGQDLVDFARKGDFDLVIGIGGGSALDLAKLAALFITNHGRVADYLNITGTQKPQHRGVEKILIPTTAGTASEVTDILVLALAHTKDVIAHPYLQADLAIVDPILTMSVPPKVTAATGADALTHAIEAYISVNSNPYTDTLALEAIRNIVPALPIAVKDGGNRDARMAMTIGSYMAGLSFYNAGVGAVHALAYPLGGEFHIPHGDSNAVMLPYVLDYIRQKCDFKLNNIYRVINGQVPLDFPASSEKEIAEQEAGSIACVNFFRELNHEIGIPQSLSDFGIQEEHLTMLAEQGIQQKRLLARCPLTLSQNDILKIYQAAFQGGK